MASPQQYDLGGVSTAKNLFLKTDQAIKVGLNSTTALWSVSDFLMIVGSFTSLYVKNENTTREATIDVLVTD